jgi:hypothetical protein
MAVMSMLALSTLGNTVELSTGDLAKGTAFDTLKATFRQSLKIGQMKPCQLNCEYDYGANKDFFKEASLSGAFAEGDGMSVSYDVTHDFVSKQTTSKVSASKTIETAGTGKGKSRVPGKTICTVNAELKDTGVEEVSAERDIELGDQTVNVQPSWLVQAKTARVKLMSKLNGGDKLSAQVDYNPDGGDVAYEVGYDHNLSEGRDLSAKVADGSLDVDYVDSKMEAGATWTASASVPYENGAKNLLDAATLSLKRSWKW